jgi:secreted PhoX family phosphatase
MPPDPRPPFAALVARRFSRRAALGGLLGASGAAAFSRGRTRTAAEGPSSLGFGEVSRSPDQTHHLPPEHRGEVLIAWGDPLLPGAPPFDPRAPDPQAQAAQFGHGNDFLAFLPLPYGSGRTARGLLVVNHEHCYPGLMWPAAGRTDRGRDVAAQIAAIGLSVVEIARTGGRWQQVAGSGYHRRLTASTPMDLSGPAAGSARLATPQDPEGREVLGTLGNCSGGVTPWGTVLSGEENIHEFFLGAVQEGPELANQRAMGLGQAVYSWGREQPRFALDHSPHEPNRFGWVVEVDPFDPAARATKRTALGRFKHEGASTVVDRGGQLVVYLGDDERGECLYRFVSAGRVDGQRRAANRDLLDRGVLSVAQFLSDGRLRWLPLVHGEGPLVAANGFHSQADVLIETRRAAQLLGGTPLDRPEDVDVNPVTGAVYAALTNHRSRGQPGQPAADAANPRAPNPHGHLVELWPPGPPGARHHAADEFRWELFLLGGDPRDPAAGATCHPETSERGWLSCPDNLTFDHRGRLWIATDGMDEVGAADGLYACDTGGEGRALTRRFLSAPRGAEVCGPCFTPDDRTLFVAIQHPGAEQGSTCESPSTRWPDFREGVPPRPAVLCIEREDGEPIG